MAESTESIIIDVKLDTGALVEQTTQAVKSLEDLKKEQKALNDEAKKSGTLNEEQRKRYAAIGSEIETLKTRVKSNTALLKEQTKQMESGNGSLNEMRQRLKQAQDAYAALSKEEREGKVGKKAAKNIKALSNEVKGLESAIGDNRRNVGNYEEALKNADSALGGFGAKMKAVWSNPWAAIIGAVVVAIKKVVDAFRSSEDRMRELQTAFAPLQGALDVVQQGFDAFAKVLSNVVVGALQGVSRAIAVVAKGLDAIGKAVGKDWGLEKRLQEAQDTTAKITDAEQKLADKRREFVTQEATNNAEISRLKAQAVEKDKYTAEERIGFIEESIRLEKANAAQRVAIAKQELQLLKDKAKNTENDAAMNDAIAQAEANVINQTTAYNNTVRKLNGQLVTFRAELAATEKATDATATATEKAAATYEDIMKKRKELRQKYGLVTDEEQQAEELRLLDELYKSEKYNKDNQLLSEEEYQAARQEIINRYEEERKRAADEREKEEEERRQRDLAEEKECFAEKMDNIRQLGDAFGQLSGLLQSLSDMYASEGEQSEEAARKQKAFAVGSIIASQAQSIANGAVAVSTGIASAAATPFPANIAAIISVVATIASVVASVASSIKQAKQVIKGDAGNYSGGGVVPGRSYTGDKLTAHVNSGEYILPKVTTDNLINTINSGQLSMGIDYQAMAEAMTQAVAAQPAPVMDYSEFTNFQKKVATYKEIARL